MSGIQVGFGKVFAKEIKQWTAEDREKLREFSVHVRDFGFSSSLPGRNKSSCNVPPDDAEWRTKVKYAQKHNLHHYHIGIPYYKAGNHGDLTSRYVIHYILLDDAIKIVDFTPHPPFKLPAPDYLE